MRHRHCFIFLLAVILIFCCYILSLERELLTFGLRHKNLNVGVDDGIRRERTNCTLATCLDLLACFVRDDRLTVYVEPLISVYDQGNDIAPIVSKEFIEIRTAILQSEFSVDDPNDACLVLPGFDTLSMRRFADGAATLRKLLTAENRFARHNILMFVFAGQTIAAEKAIIARSQSFLSNFRYGFDVSIPMWVPYPSHYPPDVIPYKRKYLISVVLRYASKTARKTLLDVFGNREDIIFYEECPSKQKMESVCARDGKDVPINRALMVGNFTIIYDRIPAFELVLVHSFRANSIPVVISDSFVLPFDDVIAWDSFSVRIAENQLSFAYDIIKELSSDQVGAMQNQLSFVYTRYFSTLQKVALTTLRVLENRILPSAITFAHEWNDDSPVSVAPPLFVPRIAPNDGFTAVILTHYNVHSTFNHIRLLAKVPSLSKIIIVWNGDERKPPPESEWPHISRPVQVIQMKDTLVTNRYIVFREISTEAVLSINDNPINCTPEQIEFGYQIWREHPASFVGYFTNAVSCVSTFGPTPKSLWSYLFAEAFVGSGFYHKYYGHLFHNWLSPELRNYINLQGMCEDIAMNVLIMSLTGSYPIKLVPRNAVSPRCSNDRSNPTVLNSTVSSCIGDFFSLSGLNYSLSQRYLDAVVYQYIPLFMDNKS